MSSVLLQVVVAASSRFSDFNGRTRSLGFIVRRSSGLGRNHNAATRISSFRGSDRSELSACHGSRRSLLLRRAPQGPFWQWTWFAPLLLGTAGTVTTYPRRSGSHAIPTVTSNVAQKLKRTLRRPIPVLPRGEVLDHALVTSSITSIRLNAGELTRRAICNGKPSKPRS